MPSHLTQFLQALHLLTTLHNRFSIEFSIIDEIIQQDTYIKNGMRKI